MDAVLGIIGTIIGTILGFLLSERGTKRREAQTEARQKSAVKIIIGREIGQNIQFLVEYLEKAKEIENAGAKKEGDPFIRQIDILHKIVTLPCPPFSKIGLESQLPILAVSLSDFEVAQILQFYSKLEKFQALQSTMVQMLNDQNAARDNSTNGTSMVWGLSVMTRQPFTDNAPRIWEECKEITTQIITDGNPVQNVHLPFGH